jgi:hypothetical protein
MRLKHLCLLLALALAVLALDPLPWEAPQPFAAADTGRKAAQGGMGSSGKWGADACEWFWIQCNNGLSDVCCGSVSSCLNYCEEICGPPCVYVGGET